MASANPAVLLCGDVTDSWVDGIDHLYAQINTTPWLRSFLEDLFLAFQAEMKGMEPLLRDSFGLCSDFQELAQRYRRSRDPVGIVHALLLYAVRASQLLDVANREPLLLNPSEGTSETHLFGISGGLWNAVAVPTTSNFGSLYYASIEAGRVYSRLCSLTLIRSRAVESQGGSWGWVVVDVAADELEQTLERFQHSMGVPTSKRVKVAIVGDRWSTIIGPPSVLDLIIRQCSDLKHFPKNELPGIPGMQHTLQVSEADIDYVVGNSSLLATPLRPGYKIWGMADNDVNATYSNWGHLLRVATLQTLSQPLDIVKAADKLSVHLGESKNIAVKMIGPSGHSAYIINVLENGLGALKRNISVENDPASIRQQPGKNSARDTAIAIVGMSGKGPGSEDVDELWNVIETGKDCHQEIPADRFDLKDFYCDKHGPQSRKCTISCRHGCFIKNPGHFDAKFFHISPREALLMDPNHRLFLMQAYEALEMAGYSAGQTRTTDPNKIGVFFGQSADDWHQVCHRALGCDAYTMQCVQRAFGPGRLAFQMKWEGPTYALDSACAGATSCIHLACMSLLSRDVDMAVAGAANVLSDPHAFSILSKAGVLSDTGNCKTYRDDADGYCRAEYSGAIVLKRLDDAIAHNDNILAVIASSARNHSGNSTSITTSDANAQERLFNKVLRSAQLKPDDISYVEMHGTGTQVGDKAEMGAVAKVFSPRPRRQPLPVGAVKASIGHSESAAGMPSVLKSIMMLQKGLVPPQPGMPHSLNPNVSMHVKANDSIVIPTEVQEFQSVGGNPRRILVNNFDAAGGNACVLLEEYKRDPTTEDKRLDSRSSHVIAASARTPSSHLAGLRRLAGWLRANADAQIQDIAYSTTARKMHHPFRFAFAASTPQDAVARLESEIERISVSSAATNKTSPADVVFVFTGQGSHYAGMGAELYRTSPIFRTTVDLCCALCHTNGFPAFLDIITDDAVDMLTKNAAQIQLAVVTTELALTAFWRSAGIEPAMVMGHSLGEYAALHAAGVLSLADTLFLVGHRARLLLERCEPESCAMLSVSTSVATIRQHLTDSTCNVACINSPSATVISGPVESLEQVKTSLIAQEPKVRATMLSVPFAFHSFQMDPILQEYKDLASGVAYLPPKIPVASTLLASIVDRPGVFSEDYLAMQTRQAVDFCGGLNAIKSVLKNPDWLEIGPGPVCTSFVRASLNPPSIKINHSIDAKASNWASISKTLANAYASGVNVDWHGLHAPYENNLRLLSLPTYAWDVKDYWITHTEERHDGTLALAHAAAPSEPFLTSSAQYLVEKTLSPKVQVTFRAGISDHGFTGVIDGHKMQQIGLASGSVFSDAAATVAKYALEYSGRKNVTTANLTFHDPELLVPLTRGLVGVDGTLFSTAIMESGSADNVMITFKASSARGDVSHDLGSMRIHYRSDPDQTRLDLDRVSYFIRSKMEERIRLSKEGTGHRIQPDVFYALFANAVEFSPDFRGVQEAYVSSDFEEAAAAILLPPDPVGTRFTSSPYWAEALLHLAGFMVNGNPSKPPQSTFVVMGYESVKQLAAVEPGKQYQTYTRITRWEKGSAYCAAYVFDTETSKIVMQAVDLRYQEFKTATWRHILDGPQGAGTHRATSPGAGVHKSAPVPAKGGDTVQEPSAPVAVAQSNPSPESNGQVSNSTGSDEREFTIIIDCLAAATGSDRSEFTDDTTVGDIGVDSIMAIEVVAAVKEKDVDLPAGFIFEYPTIGDLRRAYGGQEGAELGDDDDASLATPSSHDNVSLSPSPEWDFALISTPAAVSESSSSLVNVEAELAAPEAEAKPVDKSLAADPKPIVVEEDTSPLPSVRITLLQGRPKSSKTPIYMIADGTGTVASFIHFQPFKSKQTVYGVDSPYFRCPSRMTSEKVGIEGVAKLIVEALVKARPTGPLQIGGYSAGCLVAFEVSRQLAAAGRSVEGLLLIDMCCPRSRVTEPEALLAEDEFSYAVFQEAVTRDSLWSSLGSSRAHFRAFFVAMNQFTPETMTTAERPAKTVIIWSERGLVNRVSNDPVLMQKLADQGVPTKPYPGFLEDPKLGTFACLVPDKGGNENLGSNGWERYTNGEVMALSVAGDHFELMMPGHVHLLQAQMEKAFKYFSSN